MDALPAFVAGIAVGLVLAAALAWIRRGSVTDLNASSVAATGARPPASASPDPSPDASSDASPGPVPDPAADAGLALQRTPTGFRATRRIVHRISTRLDPRDGLTIEADGQTYHRLEDVPDPATREQVRSILASLPGEIADPGQRDRVEAELREAGIEDADPGATPPPA